MSSARELLDQADALMQRNRRPLRGDEIPELTDVVPDDALPRAARTEAMLPRPAARAPASVDDIPELTEAVEEIEAPSIQEYPDDPDELSRWLQEDEPKIPSHVRETPRVEVSQGEPRAAVAGLSQMPDPLPEAMLRADARVSPDAEIPAGPVTPPATVTASWPPPADAAVTEAPEEIFFDDVPDPAVAEDVREPERAIRRDDDSLPAPDAATPPSDTDDPERWNALAEEIRMQVLQRIDIFTDTGLREQLTARLQPVVDRASADLVATINREVGQMLRTYVAEAIEREIEHWRHGGG